MLIGTTWQSGLGGVWNSPRIASPSDLRRNGLAMTSEGEVAPAKSN